MSTFDDAFEAVKKVSKSLARKAGDSQTNRGSRGAAQSARRRAEALEAAARQARLNNQSTDSNNR